MQHTVGVGSNVYQLKSVEVYFSNHWHIANGIQHRKNGEVIKLYISEFQKGIHIYTVEENNNIQFVK